MPRESRKRSSSGIYHIMLRGINRQQIFEDDEDYIRYLKTLEKYREECGYSLYGYFIRRREKKNALIFREAQISISPMNRQQR